MKREFILVKNYEMMIAGKKRIIPEVKLYKSLFDQGAVYSHMNGFEFEQICLGLIQQMANDKSYVLTIEEVELFRTNLTIDKNIVPQFNSHEQLSDWFKQFYLNNHK
jgi:hypothetical protein